MTNLNAKNEQTNQTPETEAIGIEGLNIDAINSPAIKQDGQYQDPTKTSRKKPLHMSEIVSELQLVANRVNAQKSTGPKSPAGKDNVKYNAVKHGFTGQVLIMTMEEHVAFSHFVKGMMADLAPVGTHETFLATSIAEEAWRTILIRSQCANLVAVDILEGPSRDLTFPDDQNPAIETAMIQTLVARDRSSELSRMSLYGQRSQRACERYKKDLRELQAERKAKREAELEEARLLYQFAETNNLTWEPKDDGFVFSREEVKIYTDRFHRRNMATRTQKEYYDKHNPVEIARAANRAA